MVDDYNGSIDDEVTRLYQRMPTDDQLRPTDRSAGVAHRTVPQAEVMATLDELAAAGRRQQHPVSVQHYQLPGEAPGTVTIWFWTKPLGEHDR